jgi:hypothetical protein
MAAIERLMNRKVEHKTVAGFEPGSASQRPAEHDERPVRRGQQRRQRPENRSSRPDNRNARPEKRNARPPNRSARPEHRSSRPEHRKDRHPAAAPHAIHAVERDAQIREARARMAADGEAPAAPTTPAASPKRHGRRSEPRLGSLLGKRDAD